MGVRYVRSSAYCYTNRTAGSVLFYCRRGLRAAALLLIFVLVASACSSGTSEPDRSNPIAEQSPRTAANGTPDVDKGWADEVYLLNPVAEVKEPTALVAREESSDLWVTERAGRVVVVPLPEPENSDKGGPITIQLESNVVVDISEKVSTQVEGGLLSLAFSVDGSLLYLHYTDIEGNTVVSEFKMVEGEATADPDSERVLFQTDQPAANHNGGQITIGPDGFLYIGLGDGGGSGDPEGHGQNKSTHLGSILRIDPTAAGNKPYQIPADNPFAGQLSEVKPPNETESSSANPAEAKPGEASGGLPEIWLWGVRNPWRFSFDRETNDLWIADVGQNAFEEVDVLPATPEGAGRGANLGWNNFEGNQPFKGGTEPEDHHRPIFTYETSAEQCSVIGGCLLYTSPSPRDKRQSRMPSSA